MNVDAERSMLIKEIEQVEDISLLQAIKAVLHYDLQSEGKISVEQYNRELDEAEARIDRGDFVTHEEAVNPIRGWRKTGS
jgi:predicted transcriptional regulator